MRKLLSVIAACFLVSCATVQPDTNGLKPGTYKGYYESEVMLDLPTGYNFVEADGTGRYEQQIGRCERYIEVYQWSISDGYLILFNLENYLLNSCNGETIESYESYTQYFEILSKNDDTLFLRLEKDVHVDGTENYFNIEEPYIWKFVASE